MNANIFRQSFRIDQEVFAQLEILLGPHLKVSTMNSALTPRQQILTALHFIGNDAQYHVNGLAHGISKSSVCRYVHKICKEITEKLMPIYVRWPATSRMVERDFFGIAGFPNIKGVIDGTLVHIDAPSIDEPAYVGRDNKHSLNVLVVAGPQNQFFYACAKYPGSIHDARAVRCSELWRRWEIQNWRPDGDNASIILGDSAYPLTTWLIPPTVRIANAHIHHLGRVVSLYEQIHRKTRFIVENSIGILKEEYPCLNYLRVKNPVRISNIIYACITLHNMQNKYHRGSYAFDDTLNRIASTAPSAETHDEQNNSGENPENNLQNDINAINRQRQILEYFAQHM